MQTDSFRLVKFRREYIDKNKPMVEDVAKLQGTITNEQATRNVLDETVTVEKLVEAYQRLTMKLAESDKSLKAIPEDVAFLMESVSRAGPENAETNGFIVEVCEESKKTFLLCKHRALLA